MGSRLVLHGRTPPRSLRDILYRNDHLVSMPFTTPKATRFAQAISQAVRPRNTSPRNIPMQFLAMLLKPPCPIHCNLLCPHSVIPSSRLSIC
jgi:hypothetical protein